MNASQLNRIARDAQRKAERQFKQEVDRVNRENKRNVDAYNRKVNTHNQKVMSDYNNQVNAHNRKVESNNKRVITDLNRQLSSGTRSVSYTPAERQLADRVYNAVSEIDSREYDVFLSYARIDGSDVANELRNELESLDVSVWFDEVAIVPGKSQSRQMDIGLKKAKSGITLLTPAYLAGRFWTERELGVLLGKQTLIPVLHQVTFDDVKEYSGILPDLAGFVTSKDSVSDIAKKIAGAVLGEEK